MKQNVMQALRSALQERKEALRERLLSCLADHVEQELNELANPPELSDDLFGEEETEAAAPDPVADLRRATEMLGSATEQVSILQALVEGAAGLSSRVAMFVCRNDQAVGWGESGFATDPHSFRTVTLPLQEDSALCRAASSGIAISSEDTSPAAPVWESMGAERAATYVAVPLKIQDRVAAILFADDGPGQEPEAPLQVDALAVLARMAEMSLETLALRTKMAAPGTGRVDRRPSRAWNEPPTESAAAFSQARPEPAPAEEPQAAVVEPAAAFESAAIEPAAAEPPAAEPVEAEAPAGDEAAASVAPQEGPEESGPAEEEGGDDPQHTEARRFARLLVSEILLYNSADVQEGKEHRDLLARLKKDLDRSEQMYRNRVPARVAEATDYFRDEVLRTLADGDPELLGN
jgi:hypothetical protein